MKQKYIARYKKCKGFTLLELLVVVAIMAILGGAIITAYDGLVSQAQKSSATHTIGALTNSIRQYRVIEGKYPDNVESLMAAAPAAAAVWQDPDVAGGGAAAIGFGNGDSTVDVRGTAAVPVDAQGATGITLDVTNAAKDGTTTGKAAILGSKVGGKFTVRALTSAETAALANAGITTFRFIHTVGNSEAGGAMTNIFDQSGANAGPTIGRLDEISIPTHAFEAPREGASRNRGRGFSVRFNEHTTNLPAMIWNAGTEGYNNVKVTADANAVLVGVGYGNASDIVSPTGNGSSQEAAVGAIRLASAPYYGDVAKNEYQHYIALYDVSQDPAVLAAVVDARGDFLDEEFAEATGQKK